MMLYGKKPLGTVSYPGGLPAVLEEFCWAWGQMIAYNNEWVPPDRYIHYDRARASDHAPARNSLANRFLGDWLVQLDTDHLFEPDVIRRLVHTADTYDIDVLSGYYQLKHPPHLPVLYEWVEIGGTEGLQPLAVWPENVKVLKIGSAGAGVLFVRKKVYDRILAELDEKPFDRIHPYSEDHSFFLRCRRLGIPAYAAMNIRSDHLQIRPVRPEDRPEPTDGEVSPLFEVEGFGLS
jgi:hypothetical protein